MPNEQYLNGIYINLIDAYGAEALPDENTFYQKMADPKYAEGVRTNLADYYGVDAVPDSATWTKKVGITQTQTANTTTQPAAFSGVMNRQKSAQKPLANFAQTKPNPETPIAATTGQEERPLIFVEDNEIPINPGQDRFKTSAPEAPNPLAALSNEQVAGVSNAYIKGVLNQGKAPDVMDFEAQTLKQDNQKAYNDEMNLYQWRIGELQSRIKPIEYSLKKKYGENFLDQISQEKGALEAGYAQLETYAASRQKEADVLNAEIEQIKEQYENGEIDYYEAQAAQQAKIAQVNAIQYDVNSRQDDFNAQVEQFNAKIGDEQVQQYIDLRNGVNKLYTESEGVISRPEFAEYRKLLDEAEKAQTKKDLLKKAYQKKGIVGKGLDILTGVAQTVAPSLPFKTHTGTYIEDEGEKLFGRAVTWAASVPKMLENINPIGDADKYDVFDKWFDQATKYSEKRNLLNPVASDVNRDIKQEYAVVDGYNVLLDENGKPTNDVRDKDFYKIDEGTEKAILEKYNENPLAYKTGKDWSLGTALTKSVPTILDMGAMIAATALTGGSSAGLIGTVAAQTYANTYQQGLDAGLTPAQANDFATIVSFGIGAIALINPMERNIANGTISKTIGNFVKNSITKADVQLVRTGKMTAMELGKRFGKEAIKNTLGENLEEVILEPALQNVVQMAYNDKAKQFGGRGFETNWNLLSGKQAAETAMITTITSLFLTPVEVANSIPEQRRIALKRSLEMPEQFLAMRNQMLNNGDITQEKFAYEIKAFEQISKQYNASKELVPEELQDDLAELLLKKYTLKNKMAEIGDDVLNTQNKKLLVDVDRKLQEIVNGTYDKAKEEALAAQREPQTKPKSDEFIGNYKNKAVTVLGEVDANTYLVDVTGNIDDAIEVPKSEVTFVKDIEEEAPAPQQQQPITNQQIQQNEKAKETPQAEVLTKNTPSGIEEVKAEEIVPEQVQTPEASTKPEQKPKREQKPKPNPEEALVNLVYQFNNTGRKTVADKAFRNQAMNEIKMQAKKLGWSIKPRENGNIDVIDAKGKQRRRINRVELTPEEKSQIQADKKMKADIDKMIKDAEFNGTDYRDVYNNVLRYFATGGKWNTVEANGDANLQGEEKQKKVGMHLENAPTIDRITQSLYGSMSDMEERVREAVIEVFTKHTRSTAYEEISRIVEDNHLIDKHGLNRDQYEKFVEEQKQNEADVQEMLKNAQDVANEQISNAVAAAQEVELSDEEDEQINGFLLNFIDAEGNIRVDEAADDLKRATEGDFAEAMMLPEPLIKKIQKVLDNVKGKPKEQNAGAVVEAADIADGNKRGEEKQQSKLKPADNANRRKAETEYNQKLDKLQKAADDAIRARQKKLDQLNQKAELFPGEKRADEVVTTEQDLSEEAIAQIMKPFNEKVAATSKALNDHVEGKEAFLSKYDNQADMFADDELPDFLKDDYIPTKQEALKSEIAKLKGEIKDALNNNSLYAVYDPKREAEAQFDLHRKLVKLIKAYIDLGITKLADIAKEFGIGEDVIKNAYDEANTGTKYDQAFFDDPANHIDRNTAKDTLRKQAKTIMGTVYDVAQKFLFDTDFVVDTDKRDEFIQLIKDNEYLKRIFTPAQLEKIYEGQKLSPEDKVRIKAKLLINEIRADAKNKEQRTAELQKQIADEIREIIDGRLRGINSNQAQRLTNLAAKAVERRSMGMVSKIVNLVEKLADKRAYDRAKLLSKLIGARGKSPTSNLSIALKTLMQEFGAIDPTDVSDLGKYLKLAEKIKTASQAVRKPSGAEATVFYDEVNSYIKEQTEHINSGKISEMADTDGLGLMNVLDNMAKAKYGKDASWDMLTEAEQRELANTITADDLKRYGMTQEEVDAVNYYKAVKKGDKLDEFKSAVAKMQGDIKTMLDEAKGMIEQTPAEKKITDALLDYNPGENATAAEMAYVLRVANNIMQNNDYSGGRAFVASQGHKQVNKDIRELNEEIGAFKKIAEFVTKYKGTNLRNFQQVAVAMAKGKSLGAKLMAKSGISEFLNAKARSKTYAHNLAVEFKKQGFSDKIFDPISQARQTIYAAVIQTKIGERVMDSEQIERWKSILNSNIENLRDKGRSDTKELADLVEKAMNEVIGDAKSLQDIVANMEKVDPEGKKVVQFFIDKHLEQRPRFMENANLFYNKDMGLYNSYTRLAIQNINGEPQGSNDDAFNTKVIPGIHKSPSKSMIERQQYETLNPNKGLDFNFVNRQMEALEKNEYDIETAAPIEVIKNAFDYKNKELIELLGPENFKLLRDKLIDIVKNDYERSTPIEVLSNAFASLSRTVALASVSQALKQITVLISTAINAGNVDISMFTGSAAEKQNIKKLLHQFEIGQRRASGSAGIFEAADAKRNISDSTSEKWAKLLLGTYRKKISDIFMSVLRNADVYSADITWMTFYKKYLRDNGLEFNPTEEWKNPNKDAAAYAETMTQTAQGANTDAGQADVFTQNPKVITNALLPFLSFATQAKARTYDNILNIIYGKSSGEAARDMAAFITEQFTFNLVKSLIGLGVIRGLYPMLREALGGDDDDDKLKKARQNEFLFNSFWQNFAKDAAYGILPIIDNKITEPLINKIYSGLTNTNVPLIMTYSGKPGELPLGGGSWGAWYNNWTRLKTDLDIVLGADAFGEYEAKTQVTRYKHKDTGKEYVIVHNNGYATRKSYYETKKYTKRYNNNNAEALPDEILVEYATHPSRFKVVEEIKKPAKRVPPQYNQNLPLELTPEQKAYAMFMLAVDVAAAFGVSETMLNQLNAKIRNDMVRQTKKD